jgi:hypothetical protein
MPIVQSCGKYVYCRFSRAPKHAPMPNESLASEPFSNATYYQPIELDTKYKYSAWEPLPPHSPCTPHPPMFVVFRPL